MDSSSVRKRKRVSRACDACFTKKDRCDGRQPVCTVCQTLKRECTYDRPERKRGPTQGIRQRLEGHIEILESILGFFLDSFPTLAGDALHVLRVDDGEGRALDLILKDTSPSSKPAYPPGEIFPRASKADMSDFWRHSDFAKAIAPSLGLSLETASEENDLDSVDVKRAAGSFKDHQVRMEDARRARRHIKSSAYGRHLQPLLPGPLPPQALYTTPAYPPQTDRPMESPITERQFDMPLDLLTSTAPPFTVLALPEDMRPDLMGHVETYFATWHTIYPFLERTSVLKWCGDPAALHTSKTRTAVVLGICAASKCSQKPEVGRGPHATHDLIDECVNNARHLILSDHLSDEASVDHAVDATNQLHTVQAWILLSLVDMTRNRHRRAWAQIGAAIRIAQHIGIDRPSTIGGHPSNCSLLTWWSLVILDTFISTSHDRAAVIQSFDTSPLPHVEDAEEWSTCLARSAEGTSKTVKSHSLTVFRALAELAMVLSQGNAPSRTARLQSWVQSLPRHIMTAISSRSSTSCMAETVCSSSHPQPINMFHLAIVYQAVRVLVHHQNVGNMWSIAHRATLHYQGSRLSLEADAPEDILCRLLFRVSRAFGDHALPPLVALAVASAVNGLQQYRREGATLQRMSDLTNWLASIDPLHGTSLHTVQRHLLETTQNLDTSLQESDPASSQHSKAPHMRLPPPFPSDPFTAQWSLPSDLNEGSLALFYALGGPTAVGNAPDPSSETYESAHNGYAHSPPLHMLPSAHGHTGSQSFPLASAHTNMSPLPLSSTAQNTAKWNQSAWPSTSMPMSSPSSTIPSETFLNAMEPSSYGFSPADSMNQSSVYPVLPGRRMRSMTTGMQAVEASSLVKQHAIPSSSRSTDGHDNSMHSAYTASHSRSIDAKDADTLEGLSVNLSSNDQVHSILCQLGLQDSAAAAAAAAAVGLPTEHVAPENALTHVIASQTSQSLPYSAPAPKQTSGDHSEDDPAAAG